MPTDFYGVIASHGDPTGVLAGSIGDLARDTVNGKLYVNQTGGASGWVLAGTGIGSGVTTFNTRNGAVLLLAADVTAAGGALLTDAALRANNLADLANNAAARTNLGLGTAAITDTGTGATNTILGNDVRLTDTRTPAAHKTSHETGGSDALAALAASVLTSGTVATARLGSGTADNTTFLRGDQTWATPVGGGSTAATTTAVVQASHGLVVGNVVTLTGANTYIKAKADTGANAEVAGIVSAVADTSNFTITTSGRVTGLSGLSAATFYYLSDVTAGALLADPGPTTVGHVSKPILYADTTTTGIFYNMRGADIGTGGSSFTLIATNTLGSDTANSGLWTPFTSIPATFNHLRMVVRPKRIASQTGAVQVLRGQFNGDTGANYNYDAAFTGSANWNDTFMAVGLCDDDEYIASYVDVTDYATTTNYKVMAVHTISSNAGSVTRNLNGTTGWQTSNTAVTSIAFFLSGNALAAGSKAWLYGLL